MGIMLDESHFSGMISHCKNIHNEPWRFAYMKMMHCIRQHEILCVSHAVKQGMKSDLVRDLKCEVGTAHLNHVESVSFE